MKCQCTLESRLGSGAGTCVGLHPALSRWTRRRGHSSAKKSSGHRGDRSAWDVLEAGILRRRFFARWVYQCDRRARQRDAACNSAPVKIFGREQIASYGGRGSTRDDKLMRGEARPLVCLEHAVSKRISFRQCKIRGYVGRIDISKLRIGWASRPRCWAAWHFVRPMHFSAVVHLRKRVMPVTHVIVVRQGNGSQGESSGLGNLSRHWRYLRLAAHERDCRGYDFLGRSPPRAGFSAGVGEVAATAMLANSHGHLDL
jgi:hypothetical protein